MGDAKRRDLAIYSPFAAAFYDRSAAQAGGAELQMTRLARGLAERGLRVGHIILPVADPDPELIGPVELVEREPYHGRQAGINRVAEARAVWRCLSDANASAVIVRGGGAYVPFVAAWCRAHSRRFIFSCANDFDLGGGTVQLSLGKLFMHRAGLRRAHAVVVQSRRQLDLAEAVTGALQTVTMIRSFCEPAESATDRGDSFLWVSRMVTYKNPLSFLELARGMPNARFRMIAIRGDDTPPELAAAVERQAAGLPNLELSGPMRREQVLELIKSSRAVVSTSNWEGMPNVFLEAWARSVPVLSLHFDPDGLIASSRLGLAASGEFSKFSSGARELHASAELAAELGANGRAYVQAEHALASVTERWAELIGQDGDR